MVTINNNVRVRSAESHDYGEWRVLWDGYNAFYGRTGDTALPDEVTRMTWARFFDVYEPVHCLVAESTDRLVGLAHYIFHRSTTMLGPTCYMQDLFTAIEARGAGVGRALIEAIYEKAKSAGCTRVYWQTHETNVVAMQLYDKVAVRSGFAVYRRDLH